jgi:hypothetical protein
LDVSVEVEALLTGVTEASVSTGTSVNLNNAMPVDIVSPFKSANNVYTTTRGIAVPYLTLENATYRFGVRANATEQFTLRGDSIYYTPGTPYYVEFTLTGGTNQSYTFTQGPAIRYDESGNILYALSACVKNPTTKAYKRLFIGSDYTNTTTTITVLADQSAAGYTKLHVVYGTSNTVTYPQTGAGPKGNTVHEGTSVKPAAVRGKDIDFYVTDPTMATPAYQEWASVQSVEITRRVTLEADEELGNTHYVSQDYNVPEVSGSVVLKPFDAAELFTKINQITNVASTRVAGPFTSVGTPIKIKVRNPDTGAVVKTFVVSDARFSPPAIQGRANQKLTVTLPFSSDGGNLLVYKGDF